MFTDEELRMQHIDEVIDNVICHNKQAGKDSEKNASDSTKRFDKFKHDNENQKKQRSNPIKKGHNKQVDKGLEQKANNCNSTKKMQFYF